MRGLYTAVVIFVLLFLVMTTGWAQLDLPRLSPEASVSQTIGITKVTVDYFRPGVKNRVIWGELVPYNEIWRTGANRATLISFDSDVTIEGNKLAKGKYSFFTIPTPGEWTIIFNKNTDLWGTSGYKQEEDALRFQVKPAAAEFTERMMFSVIDLQDDAATLVLQWEKLQIPLNIKVDVNTMVMEAAAQAINWRTPYQAAGYVLDSNLELEKGKAWLDISQSIEKNYWNTTLQARFLEKMGKKKDAVKTMEEALKMATEMDRAPFNQAEMESLLNEWKK
ncbi:MAG: DUF2911 domain-containing protein [bacterium]|nr:MAG: DUF2911 domain-containing protein [bacterium]